MTPFERPTVRVRVTCPICRQDVCLVAGDLNIYIGSIAAQPWYSFRCSSCGPVRRPVGNRAIDLLRAAGAPTINFVVPAKALEPRIGPSMTVEDLLASVNGPGADNDSWARTAE
jgi:hypothetical protein